MACAPLMVEEGYIQRDAWWYWYLSQQITAYQEARGIAEVPTFEMGTLTCEDLYVA